MKECLGQSARTKTVGCPISLRFSCDCSPCVCRLLLPAALNNMIKGLRRFLICRCSKVLSPRVRLVASPGRSGVARSSMVRTGHMRKKGAVSSEPYGLVRKMMAMSPERPLCALESPSHFLQGPCSLVLFLLPCYDTPLFIHSATHSL